MRKSLLLAVVLGVTLAVTPRARAQNAPITETSVIYTGTSPYHNIAVVDENNIRTLYFDDTMESCMETKNPYAGAFEYTDYFQTIFLWKPDIKNILMLGLGGGSTQKAMFHYHTDVTMETAEIDPMVADVAQKYFSYNLNARQKLNVIDGRQFLTHTQNKYDAILMDAYTQGRYGASIPYELVTKEFFQLAKSHLAPDGVLAYNVITILQGYNTSDIVASIYRTLKEVFPQVYVFQAQTSLNVVIVATLKKDATSLDALKATATAMIDAKKITFPNFLDRLNNLQTTPPKNSPTAPVLTDDFAPVESLTSPGSAAKPAAASAKASASATKPSASATTPAKLPATP
jgi:spermidine synthase